MANLQSLDKNDYTPFFILGLIVKFFDENIARKILDIKPRYMTDKTFG